MPIMSIITIIQIQLIPNCSSQTKGLSRQLTNRTPILMIAIIIIINIWFLFAQLEEYFSEQTPLTQNGFSNYIGLHYYCKACAHERSLEGLRSN